MKLKVKDMDIATGGVFVVVLNEEDAKEMDLHALDRIKISFGHRFCTAIVDIAESEKTVPKGKIGLFEEVIDKLQLKDGYVNVSLVEKPSSVEYIRKKLNGGLLSKKEIRSIIRDITDDNLTVSELTYFVSACYTRESNISEISELTSAIAEYGEKLNLKNKIIFDKHCVGGVPNNRTTMIVVPILAAAGMCVPKTSSRSITSPSGTADTMEVLAPVSINVLKMKKIVEKINGCMVWGGAMGMASADDKLIKIRNFMRIDPESLLLSSILAKKAAVGATHVLIDIPVGKCAKFKHRKEAQNIKNKFEKIGKKLGMKIKIIITDGKQPIGNGVGPALEARDVLWTLLGDARAPKDLKEKSLYIAGEMFKLAGVKNKAKEILENGLAYKKMRQIIKAQGGDPNILPVHISLGKHTYIYRAKKDGKIKDLDIAQISRIARLAGAPRNKGAGIYFYKHENEKVKKGEKIFKLYAENKEKLKFAVNLLKENSGVI